MQKKGKAWRLLCIALVAAATMMIAPSAAMASGEGSNSDTTPASEPVEDTRVSFTVTGLEETETLTVMLKSITTKRVITLKLSVDSGYSTEFPAVPGIYVVESVETDAKDISVYLMKEKFEFENGKNEMSVKAIEKEDYTFETFLRKNAITGVLLLGCGIALFVINAKKKRDATK